MSKTLQTLTESECSNLLEELQPHSKPGYEQNIRCRNHVMSLCMLDAGLRVGEMVQLRQQDLYFGDHPCSTLIIRAEISKRHHERLIPTTNRLFMAIDKLHHIDPGWNRSTLNPYAFRLNNLLTHISVRRVQQIISLASQRSIGRKIHPHILRHTFATRLMSKTSMRVVQQLLGHANISSTQIYTHPNHSDLEKAIDELNIHPKIER